MNFYLFFQIPRFPAIKIMVRIYTQVFFLSCFSLYQRQDVHYTGVIMIFIW